MPKLYNLPNSAPGEGWAVIVIDVDRGFFATVSDWGNYAYLWSNPGGEFRRFLINCDAHYLYGKLMSGRPDMKVFDGEATKAAILEHLEEANKTELEIHGKPWKHYDKELDMLAGRYFGDKGEFESWLSETLIEEAYEFCRTSPEQQCTSFCEKVMPRFKKLLHEELAKEEQDKKDAEALRRAAPEIAADVRARLRDEFPVPPPVPPEAAAFAERIATDRHFLMAHGELAAQPAPQVAGPTVGAMCEDMDAICECGDVWGNHSSVPPHAGGRDGAPLCTSFKKKEF
jgi:hypothetical protein